MSAVPAGGPSTINGVLYQLLFSLLTLGGFRVAGHRLVESELEQVTLILEPSTGGDQQAIYPAKRVVTQLKARSTRGPWSLQEVVRGVLPDLYSAVDLAQPDTEYRFVTEGGQGRWAQVEELFQKLPVPPASGDCLSALDDDKEIRFGRSCPKTDSSEMFWGAEVYNQRWLFQKIVDTLRDRGEVASEPYDETCRKTWTLLRGFQFVGGIGHQALRDELDRWLLARIGPADRLPEKRDHLLLELGRQACSGDARVDANAFLASHGLADTSLTQWVELSRKAHEHLGGVLRRKRVYLSEDVRPELTNDILNDWSSQSPVRILSGESGSGKTWHGYRALLTASEGGDVAILVDSRGDAKRDLEEAADTFWHSIVGVDEAPPLNRLRARLKQIDPVNQSRRLTLLVDNVTSPDEARRLIEANWEGMNVRLAITCPMYIAEAVRRLIEERGREVRVNDYTIAELHTFLSRVVGVAWEDVPFDVQSTILRPLLADLFGELVCEGNWQPRNEYDLYEQAWNSLRRRGVRASDLNGLRRVALDVLTTDVQYPWVVSELREKGLDADAVDRFITAGWLRETTGGEFEIWHDRLLNWTVAEAVAHELQRDPGRAKSLLQAVANLLTQPLVACGRMLGYVPMDVTWLVSGGDDSELLLQVVQAYEAALGWQAPEVLFKKLLPTLGSRAVPALLNRLHAAAETRAPYIVNNVVDGLVATGDDGIRSHAMELLASRNAKFQRAAVGLIAALPMAEALDRLWTVHAKGVQNPNPYLWEKSGRWSLYEETFAALKACVAMDIAWLERTIHNCDPTNDPVHDLAYLLSAVGDEHTWARCKQALLSKVDSGHERAIASCILTFRDRDELEWLEARIDKKEDLVGVVALRALIRIEPARALALLSRLDENELYLSRHTILSEFQIRLPGEVTAHFARILRTHDRPWKYALVLQGREDLVDAPSIDFLLDRLAELFANALESDRPRDIPADCRHGLSFINAVTRPELLDHLRRRRGSALEKNLAEWAIAPGPPLEKWEDPDRSSALDALARIGGDDFSRALNVWLEGAGWGGMVHALKLSQRRASPRTIDLLTALSETGGTGNEKERAFICGDAAAALATHQCWRPVLRYYLRVGLRALNDVKECSRSIDPPLDDSKLAESLAELRGENGPTPGSVLCTGVAARRDLQPEVRAALRRAQPGSDLAAACLLALQWLRDTDPETVSVIAAHLDSHMSLAIDALRVNGSPGAYAELVNELRRRPDLGLAIILSNDPEHRDVGIAAIQRFASDTTRLWSEFGLAKLIAYMRSDVLRAVAECPEIFALAEEVGFSRYEGVRGEKAGALRIIGTSHPDAALRMALMRMQHPDTPDAELYAPVVAAFAKDDAVTFLIDVIGQETPTRVVQSIGHELAHLDATSTIYERLRSSTSQQRLAACRVAGFLPPTDKLEAEVRARIDDTDKRISSAAVEAHERLQRTRIAQELVRALLNETDQTHKWVLLDALVTAADPYDGGVPIGWQQAVHSTMPPALARHMEQRLNEQKKKLKDKLNRDDRGW